MHGYRVTAGTGGLRAELRRLRRRDPTCQLSKDFGAFRCPVSLTAAHAVIAALAGGSLLLATAPTAVADTADQGPRPHNRLREQSSSPPARATSHP